MRQGQHAIPLTLFLAVAGTIGSIARTGSGQAPAAAETAKPAAAAPPVASTGAALPRIDPTEYPGIFARLLARITLIDLKLSQRPGPTEYQLTQIMLEDARQRMPEDLDLLRLLSETCVQAGDEKRVLELTRMIHKLDPSDKVAEMTLIASAITSMQTVGERVKALKTFLGPRGEGIDPGVRSRLALDLALLLREQSDAAGFSEALRQSLRLDPTNKEAAGLLHAVVLARDPSPREVVESLLVLIAADPIDPAPSLGIARIMADNGAVVGAKRFYDLHVAISRASGEGFPIDVAVDQYVAKWASDSAAKVVSDISQLLISQRRAERVKLNDQDVMKLKAEQSLDDGTNRPEVFFITLPSDLVRVWAVAAHADGNEVFTSLALDEMQANADAYARNALDDKVRGEAMTADDARKQVALREADLLWIRCVVGMQIDQAKKQIEALRANTNVSNETLARLEGWTKIRDGEIAEGEELLRREAEKGDLLSDLGLAVAQELRGETAAAGSKFAELSAKLRGTLAGEWAKNRAARLGAKAPPPSKYAAELESLAAGVPDWLEKLATNPGKFVTLALRPVEQSLTPFCKASVEIAIRNDAPIALAVGNERAINSRVLLTAEIKAGVKDQEICPPEVVSLDRRYVLAPGEEMRVQVWAEQGLAAWVAELNACDVGRQRWRMLQGFRVKRVPSPTGKGTVTKMEPGPFSLTADTPMVYRSAVPGCGGAAFDADVFAKRLETSTTEELMPLIAAVRYRLTRDEESTAATSVGSKPLAPAEKRTISAALADRYQRGNSTDRTMMLLMLSSARFFKSLLEFDAAIMGIPESDEQVLRYKLLTRAVDKDDAVLAAGDASTDETTRTVAALMRKRLVDNPRTYSRLPSTGSFSVTGN